jgi:glutathione S-transferase
MTPGFGKINSAMSWDAILEKTRQWWEEREARPDDVPLVFYRDANTWCPYCHRVFFYLEERGLRYSTERIHLQSDPREPRKQAWYLDISPRGSVPALRIRDEVVLESLDILERLDREFPPDVQDATATAGDWARAAVAKSGAFNSDDDEWLHNLDARREDQLFAAAKAKLRWLEDTLAAHQGPFFLPGPRPSWVDAAFVGFLTRIAANYAFFKGFDVRAPENG